MEPIKYSSQIGKKLILIEYRADKETKSVYMDNVSYDDTLIKSFVIVLKNSIIDLKKKGYETLVQAVTCDDWTNFLKKDKRWSIHTNNEPFSINIKCKLDDAADCILKGLGFLELEK